MRLLYSSVFVFLGHGYGSYLIALRHSSLFIYLKSPRANTFKACPAYHMSSSGVNLGTKRSYILKTSLFIIFLHRIVKKLTLNLSLEFLYTIMRRVDAMCFYT